MFYQGTILSERTFADALFERGWPKKSSSPTIPVGSPPNRE